MLQQAQSHKCCQSIRNNPSQSIFIFFYNLVSFLFFLITNLFSFSGYQSSRKTYMKWYIMHTPPLSSSNRTFTHRNDQILAGLFHGELQVFHSHLSNKMLLLLPKLLLSLPNHFCHSPDCFSHSSTTSVTLQTASDTLQLFVTPQTASVTPQTSSVNPLPV